MRCLTFKNGALTPGIKLVRQQFLGWVLFLGEEKNGEFSYANQKRFYIRIKLHERNPPEISSGRIYDAHPVPIGKNDRYRYVLAKPLKWHSNEQRVLVRIHTGWDFDSKGKARGYFVSRYGQIQNLAVGYGCTERLESWEDGLVVMTPNSQISICVPSDCALDTNYLLSCSQEDLYISK